MVVLYCLHLQSRNNSDAGGSTFLSNINTPTGLQDIITQKATVRLSTAVKKSNAVKRVGSRVLQDMAAAHSAILANCLQEQSVSSRNESALVVIKNRAPDGT